MDLPAITKKILDISKKDQIYYLGHSEGTTQIMSALTLGNSVDPNIPNTMPEITPPEPVHGRADQDDQDSTTDRDFDLNKKFKLAIMLAPPARINGTGVVVFQKLANNPTVMKVITFLIEHMGAYQVLILIRR